MASMNLLCMWIYRGFDHYLAGKGAVAANECGRLMMECFKRDACLRVSKRQGTLSGQNPLAVVDVFCDLEQFGRKKGTGKKTDGIIHVVYGNAKVEIIVKAPLTLPKPQQDVPVFVEAGGGVFMEVAHYSAKSKGQTGIFLELKDLGKNTGAMKTFPVRKDFSPEDGLWLEYAFYIWNEGEYSLTFELEPANPAKFGGDISICYELNRQGIQKNSVLEEGYMAGVSRQWAQEAVNHVRKATVPVVCRKGENRLRFYAAGCENVLERICLERKGGLPA